MSAQKIRNILLKVKPSKEEDAPKLKTFLELIEKKNGYNDYDLGNDGEISGLSMSMKKAHIEACSICVQIDTSFNLDCSKYKLCAFCYLNPTTNKSELCALPFLAYEKADIFTAAFRFFKNFTAKLPVVFIFDKDFKEIALLKSMFPNATILLCNFHVIKYFKNFISIYWYGADK